jgi:DNA-directed RNA polymerase alpha subunit
MNLKLFLSMLETHELVDLKIRVDALIQEKVIKEDITLESLDISVRCLNAFKGHGITTLQQAASKTYAECARFRGVGVRVLSEMTQHLKAHGLYWKQ